MSKIWKMTAVMILAVSMCLVFSGCGNQEESPSGMENPMTEVDEQGLIDATGIDMPAPEGAEDVQYFVIEGEKSPMGEMRFTLDGKSAYLRSIPTDVTSFFPEEEDMENIPELDQIDELGDISGLNYTWETFSRVEVCERDAYCVLCDDVGYIAWIDTAPGVLYNLGMEKDADAKTLKELAEKAFHPVQGND